MGFFNLDRMVLFLRLRVQIWHIYKIVFLNSVSKIENEDKNISDQMNKKTNGKIIMFKKKIFVESV